MPAPAELFFDISLAEWSLHKTLFEGKITNLDFPAIAKNEFGIDAVEYVNQFFKDKAQDKAYLQDLKVRADDNGVKSLLIMIDGEGGLGATNDKERTQAIENHYKWVEAAQFLGCHSIRVNAYGQATAEEVHKAAVDALGRLATFAKDFEINVIVENHGGYSSNGDWMSTVMKEVNMENCGML
ncbi:MAG: TIM barrel protein, partial [Bacteroidota bacterium]